LDAGLDAGRSELLALTVEIVSAHVASNPVPAAELGGFIGAVFGKLNAIASEQEAQAEDLVPAVPIKKSVTEDYIVCLEDGKMLKRHLMTSYGMTPADYRAKWGLPYDYPMVAPSYAAKRQELAKKIGLGRKWAEPAPEKLAAKRRRRKAS
jgi:predicted transcriptional regulator